MKNLSGPLRYGYTYRRGLILANPPPGWLVTPRLELSPLLQGYNRLVLCPKLLRYRYGDASGLQPVQVVHGDDGDTLADAVSHQALEARDVPIARARAG